MYKEPKILVCGDRAIAVEFGDEISKECNESVIRLYKMLQKKNIEGIDSVIPTYRSLLIKYNPLKITYEKLLQIVKEISESKAENQEAVSAKVYEIPVVYGGEFGPDLDFVAKYNNLTAEEVINIHTQPLYKIYMIGFTMGFAYLGGMSERIATPRLEKPRTEVKAGSVGIAGSQTGIYPLSIPGGWRIIGRTPVKLYNPSSQKPFLFEAGDYVKFVRITEEQYYQIENEVKMNVYQVKISDFANHKIF
ncbi:5-oxoprolinase subunit PxpB [Caldicellulosiruptor changbaiensis]|uniref:5-oxoprolinase subunit PxpB n=1 Tax=Caldicellulosiruptor changbaiensis TaxID=1222016 RepID=A0A3T0D774_9FIRM|nr:5-oxoprolinase subunit PxpB [Caldicellulosiruptor changbaiensis]AZT90913.1 5-oxoprolinase subunit PxpB [Caldicellulosiruptor changbaiensis]